MKRVSFTVLGVCALALLFSPSSALAAPILGLSNTGMDTVATGRDDSYTVGSGGPAAYLVDLNSWLSGSWVSLPNAKWITDVDQSGVNGPPSYYRDGWEVIDFILPFSMTGLDPDTASIWGTWSADNGAEMYLNGNWLDSFSTPPSGATTYNGPGHTTLHTFSFDFSQPTYTGLLTTGANELTFRVFNEYRQGTGNPLGLLVDIDGTAQEAQAVVPEPLSMAIWGVLGSIGAAFGLRRRQATLPEAA